MAITTMGEEQLTLPGIPNPAPPAPPRRPNGSALNTQVGGTHYSSRAIQPIEFIHANGLGYAEGAVVKYVTRWRDKGGIADLEKARHFLALLIELEANGSKGERV